VLWNQSRLLKGLHHKQPSYGMVWTSISLLSACAEARWRLARQLQFQLLDEQLGIGGRLCVAWQNQPALIDSRDPDVDHLDLCQLLLHRRRRQSRGVQQEALLQVLCSQRPQAASSLHSGCRYVAGEREPATVRAGQASGQRKPDPRRQAPRHRQRRHAQQTQEIRLDSRRR
jgi:hypothetical protein